VTGCGSGEIMRLILHANSSSKFVTTNLTQRLRTRLVGNVTTLVGSPSLTPAPGRANGRTDTASGRVASVQGVSRVGGGVAISLAELLRSGDLTAVWVPDQQLTAALGRPRLGAGRLRSLRLPEGLSLAVPHQIVVSSVSRVRISAVTPPGCSRI
jgi:hypothetical protein